MPEASLANAMVLLVFLHGFKGSSEHTFGDFPERLGNIVQQTHPNVKIDALVYPTYETRGALQDASAACCAWLKQETAKRGDVAVILVGHSMGGIVAADTAAADEAPRVLGILAFDTPYYGVNPHVFKHQFHAYAQYASSIRRLGSILAPLGGGLTASMASSGDESHPTSRWIRTGLVGAGTLAFALAGAGAASFAQQIAVDSYTWLADHLAFVGNLWDEKSMNERVARCEAARIPIHCMYNVLLNGKHTFILAPDASNYISTAALEVVRYILTQNAPDEVSAHCGMFRSSNPAYFNMGLGAPLLTDAASVVSSWLD